MCFLPGSPAHDRVSGTPCCVPQVVSLSPGQQDRNWEARDDMFGTSCVATVYTALLRRFVRRSLGCYRPRRLWDEIISGDIGNVYYLTETTRLPPWPKKYLNKTVKWDMLNHMRRVHIPIKNADSTSSAQLVAILCCQVTIISRIFAHRCKIEQHLSVSRPQKVLWSQEAKADSPAGLHLIEFWWAHWVHGWLVGHEKACWFSGNDIYHPSQPICTPGRGIQSVAK